MDAPEIRILLLGDAEVGKSAFLSRMIHGPRANNNNQPLPTLKDLDQPFIFDVNFSRQPFRLEFYDTSSPTHYTLLEPHLLILCYDITRRSTLLSVSSTWKHVVETHFNYDESIPVVLLGLKRDLRREKRPGYEGVDVDEGSVMPFEGLNFAQEMRCDRYAECSALTGELCKEVFEDLARVAAMTTKESGGRSEPPPCCVM